MAVEWPYVVQAWDRLDVPQGWRVAQATRQGILMLPAAEAGHARIATEVMDQLAAEVDRQHFYAGRGFPASLPGEGFFVPDLCIMDRAALRKEVTSAPMSKFVLVVEITMPESATNDRVKKWRAYARGGVPQYLLIDPYDPGGPTTTLFTVPADDGYRESHRLAFGARIQLKEPVPFAIDSDGFPRPELD